MTPETLRRARSARGFMPEPEGLALHRAGARAAASGLGPLLEIGTYCGKSALYLGDAARRGRSVLFSVDHHHGSEENQAGWEHHDPELVDPATGLIDTLPWARRAVAGAGLEPYVVLVVGESVTVAGAWSTPLSLVFIDGGHGRDVAWADYHAWAPKVAAGGWLAIHDVFPDPADGGRPPYEIFCEALEHGGFEEDGAAGCGSLRVLRRRHPAPPAGPGRPVPPRGTPGRSATAGPLRGGAVPSTAAGAAAPGPTSSGGSARGSGSGAGAGPGR